MAGRCAGDRVGLGAVAHAEWRQGVVPQEALNSTIGPVGGVASPSWCCTSGSWQGAAATGIRTNLLVSGGGAGARVTAIA